MDNRLDNVPDQKDVKVPEVKIDHPQQPQSNNDTDDGIIIYKNMYSTNKKTGL